MPSRLGGNLEGLFEHFRLDFPVIVTDLAANLLLALQHHYFVLSVSTCYGALTF